MVSSSFDIDEFFSKIKDRSYQEIIVLADREATAGERLECKTLENTERSRIVHYVGCLKDFILYLRHGVRTRAIRDLDLAPFNKIRMDH